MFTSLPLKNKLWQCTYGLPCIDVFIIKKEKHATFLEFTTAYTDFFYSLLEELLLTIAASSFLLTQNKHPRFFILVIWNSVAGWSMAPAFADGGEPALPSESIHWYQLQMNFHGFSDVWGGCKLNLLGCARKLAQIESKWIATHNHLCYVIAFPSPKEWSCLNEIELKICEWREIIRMLTDVLEKLVQISSLIQLQHI